MPDLTPKQARFVEEYIVDLNGSAAAIRAGYSKTGASVEAARLLANAKIGRAVAEALKSRSERTKIDADWVLKRLADEVEADVADLYDDKGNLKPIREWPKIWRQGLLTGIDVVEEYATVKGKRTCISRVKKPRFSDRIRRIELIGKHVGVQAFREQVGIGDPDGKPLVPEEASRELARALAFALAAGKQAADKADK